MSINKTSDVTQVVEIEGFESDKYPQELPENVVLFIDTAKPDNHLHTNITTTGQGVEIQTNMTTNDQDVETSSDDEEDIAFTREDLKIPTVVQTPVQKKARTSKGDTCPTTVRKFMNV